MKAVQNMLFFVHNSMVIQKGELNQGDIYLSIFQSLPTCTTWKSVRNVNFCDMSPSHSSQVPNTDAITQSQLRLAQIKFLIV